MRLGAAHGTISDFTRSCRSDEVTSDEVFIIGADPLVATAADDRPSADVSTG